MITAIALLKVERDKIHSVGEKLSEMPSISEVYSVTGRYDLVAILRVKNSDDLEEVMTEHMLKVAGIEDSETLVAMRVYSRHDLEAMFSIGTDE